jgi:hypothetical protein
MTLSANHFSNLLKEALGLLYEGLIKSRHSNQDRSWFRREQEIVSLFAFKYLVPILQREGIDPGVLRVEGRVPQLLTEIAKKERAARDLVVWEDCLDTVWRRPDVRPLAVLEWKLSTSKPTPRRFWTGKKDSVKADLDWLNRNSRLMGVGYSVFVEWPEDGLKITCKRVSNDGARCVEDLLIELPHAAAMAI